MRQLLKIGITQGIASLAPILMWALIGIIYGKQYSNIFTITYSFQFIWNMIYACIIGGCLIYESKNILKTRDYSNSSVIISTIVITTVYLVFIVKADIFFNYMKLDKDSYYIFYIFSLMCLAVNLLISGIVAIKQFDGNEQEGLEITLKYYVIQIVVILMAKVVFESVNKCVIVSLILIGSYAVTLGIKHIKIDKFRFNILVGLKYRLYSIVSNTGMFITYFFGLRLIFDYPEIILVSYNLLAISTDTQWDMLSSIKTVSAMTVCDNRYEEDKKVLARNVRNYSWLLVLSSLIMVVLGATFYTVDIKYLAIIFILEVSCIPIDAMRFMMAEWININRPSALLMVIPSIYFIVRAVMSIAIVSPYALSFALFVSANLVNNLMWFVLYKYERAKILREY